LCTYEGNKYEALTKIKPEHTSSQKINIEARGFDVIIKLHAGEDWSGSRDDKFIAVIAKDCFLQFLTFHNEIGNRIIISIGDAIIEDLNNKVMLKYWERENDPREDNERLITAIIESIHISTDGKVDARFEISMLPIHVDLYEDSLALLQRFVSNDHRVVSSLFSMERLCVTGFRNYNSSYMSYVNLGYENIRMQLDKFCDRNRKPLLDVCAQLYIEATQNVSMSSEWMNSLSKWIKGSGGDKVMRHIGNATQGTLSTVHAFRKLMFEVRRKQQFSVNDALLALNRSLNALQSAEQQLGQSSFMHQSPKGKGRSIGRITSDMEFFQTAEEDHLKMLLPQFIHATQYKQASTPTFAQLLMEKILQSYEITILAHSMLKCEAITSDKCRSLHNSMLKNLEENIPKLRNELRKQDLLIAELTKVCKEIQQCQDGIEAKEKILKNRLRTTIPDVFNGETIAYPLDPSIDIVRIDDEDAKVFKSNTSPACITLRTRDGSPKRAIFKVNDDLRQDFLVQQVLRLMDMLLKKQGLDMKLTPYDVLPCGDNAGFLVCVTPSTTVEEIVNTRVNGVFITVKDWIAMQCNSEKALCSMEEAQQNYARSCAGYCVISYVLGIGDRHLENLMMQPNGKLFHIDFGYILGAEPTSKKLLQVAPEMKLSTEMVYGLGGKSAYNDFCQQVKVCYIALRKHAQLFLDVFGLMSDAGIGNITKEGVELMRSRFRLDLDTEDARDHILDVLDDCAGKILPGLSDRARSWIQATRK
jgi:hypothetical protein